MKILEEINSGENVATSYGTSTTETGSIYVFVKTVNSDGDIEWIFQKDYQMMMDLTKCCKAR